MNKVESVLLEVWREVGRHLEIQKAAARLHAVIGSAIPLRDLIIRRFDLQRTVVETVAHAAPELPRAWTVRTEYKVEALNELLAWCRRGEVARVASPKGPEIFRPALPRKMVGGALVGPLSGAEGPLGLFIMTSPRGEPFTPFHQSVALNLMEPMSVALMNDARVSEIATLREAAEADKRTLLTRLGRQDVGDVIVGANNGLSQVMERVDLVARSDAPVLIFGETGSGKEVIARAIHSGSPRATAPFLRVNCGAIPPDLIDSELFGHEKGSFTGAANLRKGWFERADGGTLFLDEIGELPPAAQVRLLRILQDGTFERVGGQRQLHVNVRIVAATHRNLQAMVAERRFREDLWYRVAVFPIYLPSLRERPEDIPELASHFAAKSARRFGLTPLAPTPNDLHLLLAYSWPGNVRELGAVIDRAAILGNGACLEIAKALGASAPPALAHAPVAVESTRMPEGSESTLLPLEAAMKMHIELALVRTFGRIEGKNGAAKLLSINPYTLRARMRKLGIKWETFRPGSNQLL